MIGETGYEHANLRHRREYPLELVARTDRFGSIVVLRHSLCARQVGRHIVEEDLFEEGRAFRLCVDCVDVDLPAKPFDRGRWQADTAIADAARSRVEIVLVDRQWGKVLQNGRAAEAADLQDAFAALEALDVANPNEERRLRRAN